MQRIIVVGAGPVGSLAAVYAAQRNYSVELYELRPDLRDPGTTPLNFSKSINLAVSERGINSLRGLQGLENGILCDLLPMRGRMIHTRGTDGELYEKGQDYDVHGRCIFASDRQELNRRLLNVLAEMPNVTLFFNHKLTRVDFARQRAWFEARPRSSAEGNECPEIKEVAFDLLIGADGAHSSVRHHLTRHTCMSYSQEYIDTLWCEFHMAPRQERDPEPPWRISKEHLHIWPAKQFMFIAIPNSDGSFTCTLFMPGTQFALLDADPALVPRFFDQYFPGVTSHIPPENLVSSFVENPHLPLVSIKCSLYHYGSSGVIVGDAAHAMAPFFGQGMNAGLEDVRVLYEMLEKHAGPGDERDARRCALEEYSAVRVPDAHAITDMALGNYVEMCASVLSTAYLVRKRLEEMLAKHLPALGWKTRYARVSFSNERYSEVLAKSRRQENVLTRGLVIAPVVILFVFGLGRIESIRGLFRR